MHLQDYYAGLALQALIAKFPLMDNDNQFGEPQSEDLKYQIAKSAQEYGYWMMKARHEYIESGHLQEHYSMAGPADIK